MFVVRHLPDTLAFSSVCSDARNETHIRPNVTPDVQIRPYMGCFEISGLIKRLAVSRIQLNNAVCMSRVSRSI